MYLLYKHTSPSGKSYIGITSNYPHRCYAHQHNKSRCPAFFAAIQKYGWDNFTHDILADGLTKAEACVMEQQTIIQYNALAPHGYNLTTGGEIFEHLPETKAKISAANKGRKRTFTEEHRANLSAAMKGKKRTDEQRKAQSERSKGRVVSEEHKAKISATTSGIPKSEEHKAKLRKPKPPRTEEHKAKLAEAGRGRKKSAETKAKISEAVKQAKKKP